MQYSYPFYLAPLRWYCAVTMRDGVQSATIDLATAQGSLAFGKRQAIIPMSGTKAGDPHNLNKEWSTGSMSWGGWSDINKMQAVCEKVKPPTKGNGMAITKVKYNIFEMRITIMFRDVEFAFMGV